MTSRRPPAFTPPPETVANRIAELTQEVASLKERLIDRPVLWSGLHQTANRRRVLIDRAGLIDTIPLPQSLSRDLAWHTDNRMGAVDAAFNPSIFQAAGRTWMLYRCECIPWFKFSKVAIVELDALLCPIKETNRFLDLPTDYDNYNAEDPRFIAQDGDSVFIAYNEGFRQALAELSIVDWRCLRSGLIKEVHGLRLREKEKNWTFTLQKAGKAATFTCDYSLHPHIELEVVLGESGAVAVVKRETQWACPWKSGEVRGGTGWFQWGSDLATVFHSSLKIADSRYGPVRQYTAGLLVKSGGRMSAISSQPILFGEPGAPEERPSQHQAVFPCGAIWRNGSLIISYGLDDLHCALACWTREELSASLQSI